MQLPLEMPAQPTESTCGPTCLHAIYRFYHRDYPLDRLISEIERDEDGGTVSVHLALHALTEGFIATTYSYNLKVFDPTWRNLEPGELVDKLQRRIPLLEDPKLIKTHQAYVEFLRLGGRLRFHDLTPQLVQSLLRKGVPILTGLSATYLYETVRELPDGSEDDVAGFPAGHFVVINGFEEETGQVLISDPYKGNPYNPRGIYRVDAHRFINAVMLGIVTYDANLLTVSPPSSTSSTPGNP